MSSLWTNKYAIMRDLSLAQGCEVPVDLNETVAAGDKPPDMKEVTDEEFYKHTAEDGDGNNGPDLTLIQQMLKMIHTVSSDSEDDDKIVEISKPVANGTKSEIPVNCAISKFESDPSKHLTEDVNKKEQVMKTKTRKKRVNVAVNSILQGLLEMESKNETDTKPMKLLKPTDFISKKEETDDRLQESLKPVKDIEKADIILEKNDWSNSIAKVNGWLDTNKNNNSDKKNIMLNWEPSTMFKKKTSVTKSVESVSPVSTSIQKNKLVESTSYRPSALADEYYQKFLERSKIQKEVHENIWLKAEKIMKEIDEKKAKEAEKAAMNIQHLDGDEVSNFDAVRLPQHRHLLTGDCLVCEIVKKNGIEIDVAVLESTVWDDEYFTDLTKTKSRCNSS